MKIRTQDQALAELRHTAERLAVERREGVTTTHLLCAIAEAGGPAWELLRDRRLQASDLIKAARTLTEDEPAALAMSLQRAAEVATSMRAPEATAVHLLVALVSQRRCSAFRTLEQYGVDIGRLRVAAMNAGLLQVGRRSIQTRREVSVGRGSAVTVPLTQAPKGITARPRPRAEPAYKPVKPGAEVSTAKPAVTVKVAPAASRKGAKRGASAPRQAPRGAASKTTFALDGRKFKLLSKIGRNLTELAHKGDLPAVFERQREIDAVLDVLAKRDGNCPCLVGPAGVGKTSVVYGLAHRIAHLPEPLGMDDRILVEVPVGELLAGTGARGSLAQRVAELQHEVEQAAGRVVLFFDDIHQLLAAGGAEEVVVELRRGFGASGSSCIGATTAEAYEALVESDASLSRLFSRLDVDEPTLPEARTIVEGIAPRFAEHHKTQIAADATAAAVTWSARYVTGRALPDKAIGIIDLAAARCRRRNLATVDRTHVAEVVAELASVPLDRLLETDGERLLRLEETLARSVVGHRAHLERMAQLIRRNAAGLGGQRPIGTFLLLGPTGVGKTETAKALAAALFGSKQAMTRLDLSEFSEAHAVARLIGAPPGYIGHEAGGQLTEAIRRRPYQVVLLDEIEKAHPEVLETFLPLLDEGRLTDGRGRTVDFTNTLIVLTSNIGAREASAEKGRPLGFVNKSSRQSETRLAERVDAAARAALAPEFFNRLDEVLVFEPLSSDNVEEIARRLLQELVDTLYEQKRILLTIDASVVTQLLADGGFDATLGARPMRRAIARLVEAPLAEALLRGALTDVQALLVRVEGGKLCLEPTAQADDGTVAAE